MPEPLPRSKSGHNWRFQLAQHLKALQTPALQSQAVWRLAQGRRNAYKLRSAGRACRVLVAHATPLVARMNGFSVVSGEESSVPSFCEG